MKVVCPYSRLQYATEITLRLEEPNTQFVYTGDSDTAYYELVKELWAKQETFVIVEHDIVVWPGALKALWECPFSLCSYQAPGGVGIVGLGCLKYGKEIMIQHPSHVEEIEEGRRSWRQLDTGLTWNLLNKGVGFHNHEPMVSHVSPDRYNFEGMITHGN